MSNKSTGGPAFPIVRRDVTSEFNNGMTMHQYYKSAAMQGILSNPNWEGDQDELAKMSGIFADVMIAEDQ